MTILINGKQSAPVKLAGEWRYTLSQILIWWDSIRQYTHLSISEMARVLKNDQQH